jgi:hypothetical protein
MTFHVDQVFILIVVDVSYALCGKLLRFNTVGKKSFKSVCVCVGRGNSKGGGWLCKRIFDCKHTLLTLDIIENCWLPGLQFNFFLNFGQNSGGGGMCGTFVA